MAEHIVAPPRIAAVTINAYLKARTEPIFRSSFLMGMLKSKGRILTNLKENGAPAISWPVRFRRRKTTPGAGTPSTRTFSKTNVNKLASVPYRTYWMGEALGKEERLMQQNPNATIVNIAETLLEEMMADFMEDLRFQAYVDGYTTANARRWMGLESMFGVNGCVSNSCAGDPNDSYANLTTNLGTYGGDWTPNTSNGWPTGTGDTEYCFWSPLVADYQNSAWQATTKTWSNTWQEALNYLISYGQTLQQNKFDCVLVNPELFRLAKDSMIGKETFEVTQASEALKLGFKTVQYNGVELYDEYGVPDGVGYAFRWDKIDLRSLQSQLVAKANDEDITTSTERFALDTWSNLRFQSPAYFGKLAAITSLST